MNKEEKLIRIISDILPGNGKRLNKPFESDAEIIDYGGKKMLFTMDEFSSEDMFSESEPHTLGWNMAVGCAGDILACGGRPLYYAHSMVIDKKWDERYIEQLAGGIACALRKLGASFIGGDLGVSDRWSYTASIVGEPGKNTVTRKGARPGDRIYITGEIGLGNMMAARMMFPGVEKIDEIYMKLDKKFKVRLEESFLISRFASSCIDTSDGLLNGLRIISEINGTGFVIENLPLLREGAALAGILSVPKVILCAGEAGEYELLFTVKKNDEKKFLSEAEKKGVEFAGLGHISSSKEKRIFGNDFSGFNISAREYADKKEYLELLCKSASL